MNREEVPQGTAESGLAGRCGCAKGYDTLLELARDYFTDEGKTQPFNVTFFFWQGGVQVMVHQDDEDRPLISEHTDVMDYEPVVPTRVMARVIKFFQNGGKP